MKVYNNKISRTIILLVSKLSKTNNSCIISFISDTQKCNSSTFHLRNILYVGKIGKLPQSIKWITTASVPKFQTVY